MAAKLILFVACALIIQVHGQVSLNDLIDGNFTSHKQTDADATTQVRSYQVSLNDLINGEFTSQNQTDGDATTQVRIPKSTASRKGCGWRNQGGVGFAVSTEQNEAEFGEFPWMVAILSVEETSDNDAIFLYACGGSLIGSNIVLTAANCVVNHEAQKLMVRAGEWDTQSTNEILPHVDKWVTEKIIHENYDRNTLHNDVALLILAEALRWEENIRPICLPEPNINFDGSRCLATGWGKDKLGREGRYQVILKSIALQVVPNSTCEDQLRQAGLGVTFNLHESFLCAGGEIGKDTCKGDAGSPLVCPIPGVEGRYYQAGIVAWGIGCGAQNVPGVYTNIPQARQWISDKLTARGVNFSEFTP